MARYLMRMATADMTVKSVGAEQVIEGKELANSLEKMVDFKRYCERATRRLGGDPQFVEYRCLKLSAARRVCCVRKADSAQGVPGWRSDGQSRRRAGKAGYKTELSYR